MDDMQVLLERWQLDVKQVRERVYHAPTPRERERWHALWLLARGWSAVQSPRRWGGTPTRSVNGPQTSGNKVPQGWLLSRPEVPPALDAAQQAELKTAVQDTPQAAGVGLANWCWKGVRVFVENRFGLLLSRSSCFGYLHRLGFVVKRPKKRLLKADAAKRAAFVTGLRHLAAGSQGHGGAILFVDEAHFRRTLTCMPNGCCVGNPLWRTRAVPSLVRKRLIRRFRKNNYASLVRKTGEISTNHFSKPGKRLKRRSKAVMSF